MKIIELIERMKQDAASVWSGRTIEEETTRDQILYGDPHQECTGVVTTCYASVDVIRKAGEAGANLIVVHEALFWNHGDRTDWLAGNTAFQQKAVLLNHYNICVWRNHDHIHAGLPQDGQYRDGIFSGLSRLLGWDAYRFFPDAPMPQEFLLPEMSVAEMAAHLNQKFRLNGVRFIGNQNCRIKRVYIPMHIMGHPSDNQIIQKINDQDIHCLLTLEMVDFTVCEYVRDAAMTGENRCIFALGHFNLEEIGMEYYAEYLREKFGWTIPVTFIQSGDAYSYFPA